MLSYDKPLDTCFVCKKQGHWGKDCPTKGATKTSESEKADEESPDIPILHCICGRGPCTILTSKTVKNPNRKFYTCPNSYSYEKKDCNFFKWVDEVKVKAPNCPCGAGACSIQFATSGDHKGKQFFACRINKGHGACNFFQWVDSKEDIKMNHYSGKGTLTYTPATLVSSPTTGRASDLSTSGLNNPPKATSGSSPATAAVSDSYRGGTWLANNLAPATLGSSQIISAVTNRASDSCNAATFPVTNPASAKLISDISDLDMSTYCQITCTGIDLCNGCIPLDTHPTRFGNVEFPRYTSESISVADSMKHDSIPDILPSESLDPSCVMAPEIISSNSNTTARDQTSETESSDPMASKDIWSAQLDSEANKYCQQTVFSKTNSDPKGSSTEASSSRIRSPSGVSHGYSQLLESPASHTPEHAGPCHHGCATYVLSNDGHYMSVDEMPYRLITRIEQLNRENGELKSEIEMLKKQVAAYVEKENVKVPREKKKLGYKSWLIGLILAVLVMCAFSENGAKLSTSA